MASQLGPSRIARFGLFEVDLQARDLRKAGLKIKLHEQLFQVLVALLERPGDVVTREELRLRVWPGGGTFVDFDGGLNTAVNKLREALGDSADSPRFIETVPRRGYRFLLPVDRLVTGRAAAEQPADGNHEIQQNDRVDDGLDQPSAIAAAVGWSWRWIALATLALGLVGGWALTRFRRRPADEPVVRLQIIPHDGGQFAFGLGNGGIALSPNGQTALFVVALNGRTALWLRPLNGTESRLVPGTEGASFPFWSMDGRSIGFFAAGKLQRIDLAGGAPAAICDAHRGWGGAWTSDGQIIFSEFGFGLRRVPATGGTSSPFTTLDASRGEGLHLWPQALPGGRFLVFVQSDRAENTGVYAASLAKPNERVQLLTTNAKALYASGSDGIDYLVWQRSGILLAQEFDALALRLTGEAHTLVERVAVFGGGLMNAAVSGDLLLSGGDRTVMQFTWFDRGGKRLATLGEPGEYVYFRLAADGRRVVAARAKPEGRDLWLLDADRGAASRLTSSPGLKGYPVWSADGGTILFASGIRYNLFSKAVAGGGDEHRLTQSGNYQVPSDTSRGGRFLLYTQIGAGTGFDLEILPLTPDGKRAPNAKPWPYLRTQFNEWNGRFSPESEPRWIAYESDESGRHDVYVDSFPERRNKVSISTVGGQYPQWSPAGDELFYVSPDQKLMQVNLKRGTDSLEPSSPRELFALPITETGLSPYEVAPDGRRFLVRATPEKQATLPLTLIVNWPALLKKREAAQ